MHTRGGEAPSANDGATAQIQVGVEYWGQSLCQPQASSQCRVKQREHPSRANGILFLGGIGCACSFLWFPLVYDDPTNHPFISTGEKEYIVCSLAQQVRLMNFPTISLCLSRCLRGEEGLRAKLLSSDGGVLIFAFF